LIELPTPVSTASQRIAHGIVRLLAEAELPATTSPAASPATIETQLLSKIMMLLLFLNQANNPQGFLA
jgi:hypothetical protein